MNFHFTPTLLEYMQKQNKNIIVVELVQVNTGDFDLSELHVQLADRKRADFFLSKKNYRAFQTEDITVLLPRFPLVVQERVTFDLKQILFFKSVTCDGIKL